ncbi:mitochondrial ribosomal protein S17 [Megachile rotundata]|uniref:mitochondrial ribosomal protein S17 n=1 Tax=Megachile rotundata TaxID=143995 RepID=UPI000258EA80|nr:PREDICTED: 28S ribosomal protein S17, mitochondrial [Megachile rotundata]
MSVNKVANIARKTETLTYLLGVCVPSRKQNVAKIRVRQLKFDDYINMYFTEHKFIFAADPEKRCKTGDTVLIQNLPEKLTRIITHKVVDVIYPLGDVTDPITGKKVVAGKYRDTIMEDAEEFGKLPSTFDFTNPGKRGRTENVRDITSKTTYMKYKYDPNDDDPYAIDPK